MTASRVSASTKTPATLSLRNTRGQARKTTHSSKEGETLSSPPQREGAGLNVAGTIPKPATKLDRIEALLLREGGCTITEMMAATGWQQHSIRGALAGAMRKRGLHIASHKMDGLRRYSAQKTA